jgi:hypothetical protein
MKAAWVVPGIVLLLGAAPLHEQQPAMSFFITSAGPGRGAGLGGLEGADRLCQGLADAAGSRGMVWRAYLSTIPNDGAPAINARDRIGKGPWHNSKGVKVAESVADLHSDGNTLSKENSLTEKGVMVNGRGDTPNMHDIITGSNLDGTAYTGEGYDNCGNWTSSGAEGSTRVGHHDRTGGGQHPTSWNSAHNSRGCGQENLVATGGNGLFYCFGFTK